MEGSVQWSDGRVRITAQLVDATNGHHIFSERYDRQLKDLFALQDDITLKVLTAMQVKFSEGEQARMWAKGTKNLEAYLKLLQAVEHRQVFNKESQVYHSAAEAMALDLGTTGTALQQLCPQVLLEYIIPRGLSRPGTWQRHR
jgi:hypothetical protein